MTLLAHNTENTVHTCLAMHNTCAQAELAAQKHPFVVRFGVGVHILCANSIQTAQKYRLSCANTSFSYSKSP